MVNNLFSSPPGNGGLENKYRVSQKKRGAFGEL